MLEPKRTVALPKLKLSSRRLIRLRADFIAIGLLLAVVFIAHGWFLAERGLHAETVWIDLSQSESFSQRFIWSGPGRPFLMLPFGLFSLSPFQSFALANGLCVAFIAATGISLYLLLRLRFGTSVGSSFLGTAVGMTVGADLSANLFSMVVLWQASLGVIVALLLVTVKSTRVPYSLVCTLALALLLVAVFTYEAIIPLMLLLGLLLTRYRSVARSRWLASGVFFAAPIWALMSAGLRSLSGTETYQSQKFQIPGPLDILSRPLAWSRRVLDPLQWPEPWMNGWFNDCTASVQRMILLPLIVCLVISVVGVVFLYLVPKGAFDRKAGRLPRIWIPLLLAASYCGYFFVVDGSGNWRTHILAMPWWGALYAVIADMVNWTKLVVAVVGVALIGLGCYSSLLSQQEIAVRWERVKASMAVVVPSILNSPKTERVTMLVDEPFVTSMCASQGDSNPFGDPYWFEKHLDLYLPGKDLEVGIVLRDDGPFSFGDSSQKYFLLDNGLVLEWNGSSFVKPNLRGDLARYAEEAPTRNWLLRELL